LLSKFTTVEFNTVNGLNLIYGDTHFSIEIFYTRILGRYAALILAPVKGLPSGARKGSLRSLAVWRTQGLALLAGRRAHATGSLRSLEVMRKQGLALLVGRRANARARFARLPSRTRNG
jgi:hypothetical protein